MRFRNRLTFPGLLILAALPVLAQQANWTGPYEPCINSGELKKTGHMTLGVRYDVSDRTVVDQFHRAFDFWAKLLDADFYDDPSNSCAIAIVSGTKLIIGNRTIVARAQFPDRPSFNGWIAVNLGAGMRLGDNDAIAVWRHEIGHLLGLKHNSSPSSLMYYLNADATSRLDSNDLHALASLHTLRSTAAARNRVAVPGSE